MHIPQKKQGVVANVLYPYLRLVYVNAVMTINEHPSDFKINIVMCIMTSLDDVLT